MQNIKNSSLKLFIWMNFSFLRVKFDLAHQGVRLDSLYRISETNKNLTKLQYKLEWVLKERVLSCLHCTVKAL